jgi:hypothetical protein
VLEFVKGSAFFRKFEKEFPQVVLNMEMLFENKLAVDSAYHKPKNFILAYNNLLSSLIFFRNTMATLACVPLKEAVDAFVADHAEHFAVLSRLRNLSAHQKMIVPAEAFAVGLYRIRDGMEYVLKIGMEQLDKPFRPARNFYMQNTHDVFHQLLLFHFLTMMDLEHTALGESLGITRRWYYHVDFEFDRIRKVKTLDIYELATEFTGMLLDSVCETYARMRGLRTAAPFFVKLPKYNFVNTLLEIDLYPNLFEQWWGGKMKPSNFGCHIDFETTVRVGGELGFYRDEYSRLSSSLEDYLARVEKYSSVDLSITDQPEEFDRYLGFVILHHWHVSRVLNPLSVVQNKIDFGPLLKLSWAARDLFSKPFEEGEAGRESRLKETLDRIGHLLKEMASEVVRVGKFST